MCDCSICIAEKEIRLCKNIAKFLQNLPFQVAKFCILDAKFEIYFCKKPRGQPPQSVERATPGEEVPGSIPAVAACSQLVGSVSV